MSEPSEGALEMFQTALAMEEKGHDFYQKALTNCQNEAGVEIFRMLAQDEVHHTRIIKKIYEKVSGGADYTALLDEMEAERRTEDLGAFFRKVTEKHGKDIHAATSDIEALEIGLDFERKAVDFYSRALAKATEAQEKRFLEEMVAEERTHVQLVADTKAYLENPADWFEAHEKPLLDG
jgi:rubrerythrin